MRNHYGGLTGNKRWMLVLPLFSMIWILTEDVMAEDRAASREPRTALVIGNIAYNNFQPLSGPVNDAREMANALKNLDFEIMSADDTTNLTKKKFWQKVDQFSKRLREKGGVGLFYFSGHGAQVNGKNYLIPIDLESSGEKVSGADVRDGAISVDWVLEKMNERDHPFNLIILDACRNEPKTKAMWGGGEGLASMNALPGTLIAYATAPGTQSVDGNPNGIYTARLLEALRTRPHLEIKAFFQSIRNLVIEDSKPYQQQLGALQTPWEAVSTTADFYFAPGDAKDIDVKPGFGNWKSFQSELSNITEAVKASVHTWIFTVAGIVISFMMLGFALMYRYVRTTYQAQLNPRDISHILHEKLSNLSRSLWPKPVYQPPQPPEPQPQPFVENPMPKPSAIYRLVPQTNNGRLKPLELTGPGNYRLGRAPARNIQLVVPSQYVSGEHLVIIVNPDYSIAIENLNPTNKTHVAGVEVVQGHIAPIQLGQTLRLGHDEVIYRLEKA